MERLALLVPLVVACNSGNDASVRIDLTELWQRAALLDVDEAELVVTGEGVNLDPMPLDPAAPTFEIDVRSGPSRRFAVEAFNPGDPERLTQYWGHSTVDLVPRATIDLTIPVIHAGRVYGTVSLSDGATVPTTVELTFTPTHPIEGIPGPFPTTAQSGTWSVPLPEGDYTVTVAPVSVSGTSYVLDDPPAIYIERGYAAGPIELQLRATAGTGAHVVVTNPDGLPHSGATVLVHDSTGAFVSPYTTDPLGEVDVAVSSGDMVSVLYSTEISYTSYYLLSAAAVEPGATLQFHEPGYAMQQSVGELSVSWDANAPGAATGMTEQYAVAGESSSVQPFIGAAQTLYLNTPSLGHDGALVDVLQWEYSLKDLTVSAFAKHFGVDPASGSLPATTWDTSPATLTFNFTNIPPGMPEAYLWPVRDGAGFSLDQYGNVGSGAVSFVLPTGFFDYVDVEVGILGMGPSWAVCTRIANDQFSTVDFDFNTELLPGVTAASGDRTSPERPTVNWTTIATPAQHDATFLQMRLGGDMTELIWVVTAPSSSSSPFQMPDMSDSQIPTEYRPVNYQVMTPSVVVELVEASYPDYRSFLNEIGVWDFAGYSDFEPWPERAMTIRHSYYSLDQ